MNIITKAAIVAAFFATATVAAPVTKTDDSAVRKTVTKIYAPFRNEIIKEAWWEHPIYSAETRKKFVQWEQNRERRKADDIDDLNNGNWLCGCQEYDTKYFRVKQNNINSLGSGKIEADIQLQITQTDTRKIRFMMVKEKGRWKVDDMFTDDDAKGLKQTLSEQIARR
jgi:hypothetical protein